MLPLAFIAVAYASKILVNIRLHYSTTTMVRITRAQSRITGAQSSIAQVGQWLGGPGLRYATALQSPR